MEFLHPSVSSKIIDNSISFVSAQGITQLFCAFTSDIGPDNKIMQITSPTEFTFHYGLPNMKKHGQAAYNIMNWLNAHGGLYALRVTPENAGFSHAVANLQTKVGVKKVKDVKGNLVEVPNVTVRTTAAYTSVSNVTEDTLAFELTKNNREKTVDGFDNHWLFAVYPKGRGKAYDKLGFRMTLTDAFDSTYPFRLYNFEVTNTLDNGSVQIIDGPFLVALDPDAVSNSNESMFIKYVVEKYSSYLNVIFNDKAYDTLGEIFNSEVHPQAIDFFTGTTRLINDKADTFFSKVTGKDEDVNINIQKYNDAGEFAGVINYVDSENEIEKAIVEVDDGIRVSNFAARLTTIDNMKMVLNRFRSGAYTNLVDAVADITTDAVGNLVLNGGSLKTTVDALELAYVDFSIKESDNETHPSTANQDAVSVVADTLIREVKEVNAQLRTGLDYARAIRDNEETLNALVSIIDIESDLKVLEITSIKGAAKKGEVIAAQGEIGVAKTEGNEEKLSAIAKNLDVVYDVLDFTKSVQEDAEIEADVAIIAAQNAYATAVSAYVVASDANQLATEITSNVNNAVTAIEAALTAVKVALVGALLEVQIQTVKETKVEIDGAVNDVMNAVQAAKDIVAGATSPDVKAAVEQSIVDAIAAAHNASNEAKALSYNLSLQNYNKFFQFGAGSDGDLDESNTGRAKVSKDLLIKAYKATIDPALTNKKEFPIDLVLDANYPIEVKNAIVTLCTEIRDDFMGILDTNFQANPQQAIDFRQNQLQVSSFMVAIFAQDLIVYDEYTGQDIKVTSPYYLASKIPQVDEQYGLHWTFVGPRRGTISGYKKLSWNPTEPWKEQLYKKQINYIEQDPKRTKFGSQLTSQTIVSALSSINNVRALLRIKRDVENLSEDYQFEFNDTLTLNSFQYNLNGYLQKWIANRACDSIKGTVYASQYDRQQRTARVKIEIVFNSIIERILIDLVVGK